MNTKTSNKLYSLFDQTAINAVYEMDFVVDNYCVLELIAADMLKILTRN